MTIPSPSLLCCLALIALPAGAASVNMSVDHIKGDSNVGYGMNGGSSTTPGVGVYRVLEDTSFESSDGFATTTYSGQAYAMATYNTLHAAVSGEVRNTYHDLGFAFEEEDGVIYTNGVPLDFSSFAEARFTQNLVYGGFTANHYISTFLFHLTGSVDGNANQAYAMVEMVHGMSPTQRWFFDNFNADENGNFSLDISHSVIVNTSNLEFSLRLYTNVSFLMDQYPDGSDASGSANFGNTLEFVGIDVRDEEGNHLSDGTITSDSGASIPIIQIPEPSAALLGAFGFLALLLRRR